ncbi:MAG: hypothetical protein WD607_00085 [Candidatus Paceibacterota bacterium]
MNNFILHGYDRSGTSAISRTLAKHPDIELVFRPFNSGPIRKKMYIIWDKSTPSKVDVDFFEKLEKDRLEVDYFVSEWHEKFSTVEDSFNKNKLHVIITNINHFTVEWVSDSYPKIEQWAIWRDPIMILNSCVKNEFYGEWYSDALRQVFDSVNKNKELNSLFGEFIEDVKTGSVAIKTAFLIATRNYFLFNNIKKGKIIDYEIFKKDANEALKPVLKYFRISLDYDFNQYLKVDLNSIPSKDGYSRNKKREIILTDEEVKLSKIMFKPLYEVYYSKSDKGEFQ